MVHVMDTYQDRLLSDRGANILRVHETVGVHFHPRGGKPLRLQEINRVNDGGVLDFAEDDVVAAPFIGVSRAFDREVGRLGAVGSKQNVVR